MATKQIDDYSAASSVAATDKLLIMVGSVYKYMTHSQIDHTLIANIGSHTHAQISTHVAGTLAQHAATTSSQLAGVISDETGSGALVFATSPTLSSFNFGEVQTRLMSTKKHASSDGNNTWIGGGGQSITWNGVNSYTGSANISIGVNALYLATTGYNNTALGVSALNVATTGYENTAIGLNALTSATTGYRNTAVGVQALNSATVGYENTALGMNALYQATGYNNTALGVSAGNDALIAITTQNNYVVIGNNTTADAVIKVAWTVVSDARDKINFGKVPHGIEFINKLNPVSYQYKISREDDTPTKDGRIRYGFLAQDILSLEGDNPVIIDNRDKESLKYVESCLIPVLVRAMQELIQKVEILEAK